MTSDDQPLTPAAEEIEAIKRIGFTADGALLHRFLRRVLEGVVDVVDESTLLSQNGRRSLARDLMRHMAEGIEARRDGRSTEDPILTRSSGGAVVAPARGARRRVGPGPGSDPAGGTSGPGRGPGAA